MKNRIINIKYFTTNSKNLENIFEKGEKFCKLESKIIFSVF